MANIPVSVQIARWAALGAIVTALGSLANTMWSDRPWWVQPAPMVQLATPPPAPASVFEEPKNGTAKSIKLFDSVEFVDKSHNFAQLETVKTPPPHWYETWMKFLWRHPTTVIIAGASLLVLLVFGVVEFYFRKKYVVR
jgi:hypothetical protein